MASRTDMRNMNRMVEAIKQEGIISKVNLVMKSGISVSLYDKLKPYMEELFKTQIEYDSSSKQWRYTKTEEIKN